MRSRSSTPRRYRLLVAAIALQVLLTVVVVGGLLLFDTPVLAAVALPLLQFVFLAPVVREYQGPTRPATRHRSHQRLGAYQPPRWCTCRARLVAAPALTWCSYMLETM